MKFLKHLQSVMRFLQLPRWQRRLVFYSEGGDYWTHFEGIIRELLTTSDIAIVYISSDQDDSGLKVVHPQYKSFNIGSGRIRTWLFETIDTDVMVLTMPDIENFQLKRSRCDVHYIYVQHSIVSLHMIYRDRAFDHYDTIFCAGPHHIEEIRAMEAQRDIPAKNLVEHGYSRLDKIIKTSGEYKKLHDHLNAPVHVLIAPSWGNNCIIETLGHTLVGKWQFTNQDARIKLHSVYPAI